MSPTVEGLVTVAIRDREDYVGSIPWIAVLPKQPHRACMEHTSGRPLYAFFRTNTERRTGEEDPEAQAKRDAVNKRHECKMRGKYLYITLDGDILHLCDHHLERAVEPPDEQTRWRKFYDQHYTDSQTLTEGN